MRSAFPAMLLIWFAVSSGRAETKTCTGCSSRTPTTKWVRQEGSLDAMGSLIAIVAYGADSRRVHEAISDALDEASRLDALLSNYKPQSEWSRMNRLAGEQCVRISPELFRLLAASMDYSRQSQGTFDISVGPLMRVWGFYKNNGHLADRAQVLRALDSVGYRNVILDPQSLTVHFAKKGVELDPGGIGKGYAVDCMVDVLRKHDIRAALVSAGGSSVYALGSPPNENGWRIDLNDPRHVSSAVQSITLQDESVSTSGSYEKYFYADGRRWSHIMDPRTGYPSQGMLSVSVIAPNAIDSEAWAKPYYILGREWTAKHKKKTFRVFMCEDRADVGCSWVE